MCSPHLETHSINCKPLCSPRELPSFALVGVYIPPPANNRLTRCHPRNYRQQCHTRDLNTLDHCYLSRPHQCLLHLILTCRQKLKTFKPVVRIVRKWTDESKLELQAWIHWLCDLTSVFVRTCMWGPSTEEAHRTLPSTGDHPPPYGKPTTIRWPEHLLPQVWKELISPLSHLPAGPLLWSQPSGAEPAQDSGFQENLYAKTTRHGRGFFPQAVSLINTYSHKCPKKDCTINTATVLM